ncbi:MAG: DUF192 domain-containing protein [Actinomycetota bacterium]
MRRIAVIVLLLAATGACAGDSPPPTSAPQPTTTGAGRGAALPSTTPWPSGITAPAATEAQSIDETVDLQVGDRTITAEIADEAYEIRTGLMFRDSLAEDAGMIFLLQAPQSRGFWMKNTRVPLSIAYMNRLGAATFEVVAIRDMEPCRTQDCPGYPPEPTGTAYNSALEVNEGVLADAGVKAGDRITVRE